MYRYIAKCLIVLKFVILAQELLSYLYIHSHRNTDMSTTLRQRLAALSPEFAAQEQQRNAMIAMQETAQLTALQAAAQRECKTVLVQARAALGTSNKVARANSKLGNAIKSNAMRDMNCLRIKGYCVDKLARACNVVEEYSNTGRMWNV
jgi:hypothetical protein